MRNEGSLGISLQRWCLVVPMTPVSLGGMLRSCSSIGPPREEGNTTARKEKRAELCTRSPGAVEMEPQPCDAGYFCHGRALAAAYLSSLPSVQVRLSLFL